MKKIKLIIPLFIILIISIITTLFITKQDKTIKPIKVPSIYINTKEEINDNYINSTITINNKQYNNTKIKLRGHITKYEDKHPYTIKFNKKIKLFNLTESKKYVLLANTFDNSLMRNKLVYDFANKTSIKYTVKSMYVDLYINNKYIGNYLLCDKIKVAPNKVNIDKNNDYLLEYDISKNNLDKTSITTKINKWRFIIRSPKNITKNKLSKLDKLLNNIEKVLQRNNYKEISKYIDINSFIDTYIIEEYFKDVDCNLSSLYMYIKGNKLYAGPIWDFDQSMGLSLAEEYNTKSGNSTEGLYCDKNIFRKLLNNKEFKNRVIKRYNELQKEIKKLYTDNNHTKSEITKNYIMYKDSLIRNNCKWKKDIACKKEDYKQRLAYVRKWLKNRNEWLLKEYNEKS